MPDDLAIDSGTLIFVTLADVYLSSGMAEEAISVLKDGLSRNPSYTLAKVILGRAYYMKGNVAEALKVLTGTYEDAKESEYENLYLGHCYRKLGDHDKAGKYYEATLKINPGNKDAKQALEALKSQPTEVRKERVEEVTRPPVEKAEEKKIEERPEPVKVGEVELARPIEEKEEKKIEERLKPVEAGEARVTRPVEKAEAKKIEVVSEPVRVEEDKIGEKVEPGAAVQEKVEQVPEYVTALELLNRPMKRLLEIGTVKGAFICSKDGLLIQNYYESCPDIDEVCAMIAAIYSEAEVSLKSLKGDALEKFIIEKEDGPICVIAAGESLLTVITKPEGKPGLVFACARKTIDEIREILG